MTIIIIYTIKQLSEVSMESQKKIKICLLGGAGVGKTSIIKRFNDGSFEERENVTLGAQFLLKMFEYDGEVYQLHIWDTAGTERYAPLANMYYRDAQAAILVYDVTSEESFQVLKRWYEEVLTQGPDDIVFAVVGNKSDLENQIQVDETKVKIFVGQIDAIHRYVSAKQDVGIKDLFTRICKKLKEKDLFMKPRTHTVISNAEPSVPTQQQKKCC